MKMHQTKVVEKIRTHFSCSVIFFPKKVCHLWGNVEKYGRTREATCDNILQRRKCYLHVG